MIDFLVAIDVILAIIIIAGVFFHQGSDGFMGETTQTVQTQVKFEPYDKIIGGFVLAFFIVTLLINYLTVYHAKGTADIDDITQKATLERTAKKSDNADKTPKTEAPLAQ